MLLGYGYMRNNLVPLRGYPTRWYVKSILFLFRVYMIKGDDVLTEISPFEAKWDEQKLIWTPQAACGNKNYANAYVPI